MGRDFNFIAVVPLADKVNEVKSIPITPIFRCLHWRSRLTNALIINSSHSPIKFSRSANLITYATRSLFSVHIEPAPPLLDRLYLPHYKSSTAVLDKHQMWNQPPPIFVPSTSACSLSSWFLLVHLILRASPHHSHHLRSHHLSLLRPFTVDLKLLSLHNWFLFDCHHGSWTCTGLSGHWRFFLF